MPPELQSKIVQPPPITPPSMGTSPHVPPCTSSVVQDVVTHLEVDITAHICPMTFVRTRLALDRLQSGQIVAVRLKGDEPRRNVPHTATEQGHQVLSITDSDDGTSLLLIRKG